MEPIKEISEWTITSYDLMILLGVLVVAAVLGLCLYRMFLRFWIRSFRSPQELRSAVILFIVFVIFLSTIVFPGWPVFDGLRETYRYTTWVLIGLTSIALAFFLWKLSLPFRRPA
jgi:hypothetical protein